MGVFLRWGAFGIIVVAALIYAYNASKGLAEQRQQSRAATNSQQEDSQSDEENDEAPGAEPAAEVTPQCEEELQVVEIALTARREQQPIDRLMRHQLIAFQSDPKRRQRLENVATKWFERSGAEPDEAETRQAVLRDCWLFSPAP